MNTKLSATERLASFFAPNGKKLTRLPVHQFTNEELQPIVSSLLEYKEKQIIKNLQAIALGGYGVGAVKESLLTIKHR